MTHTYKITAEQDDIPVRGNAMASGDTDADRACEDEILARLDRGEIWAWAHVTVTCTCDECGASGRDTLGGCSYASERDFIEAGDYYPDMQAESLRAMRAECTCYVPSGTDAGAQCEP